MKKKKKPSFLTVYLSAVTCFILVCIVIYAVMAVMLNNYEAAAERKRIESAEQAAIDEREAEESRAAESERLKNEAENERLKNEADFKKRQSAVSAAAEAAVAAIKNAAFELSRTSPSVYLTSLVAKLNESGSSPLCPFCKDGISEYERSDSLTEYIDSQSGKYVLQSSKGLKAEITKGDIRFDITLKETYNDGYMPDYGIDAVKCSLRLNSYTVSAPDGAVVTVNGKTASGGSTGTPLKYADIPEVFAPPTVRNYDLDGFVYEPAVEASLDGRRLVCQKNGSSFDFEYPDDESGLYKEELSERILKLIFDHTDFIAGVYKFSQIKGNMHPGTKLYEALSGFDNRWYYTYDYIKNENAKISGVKAVSDRLVKATVSYDQTLYNSSGKRLRKVPMKFEVLIGTPAEPSIPSPDKSYPEWLLLSAENI